MKKFSEKKISSLSVRVNDSVKNILLWAYLYLYFVNRSFSNDTHFYGSENWTYARGNITSYSHRCMKPLKKLL